jgi:GNAT superfamily N-acetyltransferase
MNNFTLRPAEPHDKAAIAALSAQIWEGEDYLARLFDNWVAQQRGRFILAFDGEELAGCNKLTELGPGEWWMEGLRVAPAWRGQGIARLLHEIIVRLANEIIGGEIAAGNISSASRGMRSR